MFPSLDVTAVSHASNEHASMRSRVSCTRVRRSSGGGREGRRRRFPFIVVSLHEELCAFGSRMGGRAYNHVIGCGSEGGGSLDATQQQGGIGVCGYWIQKRMFCRIPVQKHRMVESEIATVCIV